MKYILRRMFDGLYYAVMIDMCILLLIYLINEVLNDGGIEAGVEFLLCIVVVISIFCLFFFMCAGEDVDKRKFKKKERKDL